MCEKSHWVVWILCNLADNMAVNTQEPQRGPFVLVKMDSLGPNSHHWFPERMKEFVSSRYSLEVGRGSTEEGQDVSIATIPVYVVPTPRQDNSDDCAVHMLHNMELFCTMVCTKPGWDTKWATVPDLRQWYPLSDIADKRTFITQLIRDAELGEDVFSRCQDAVARYASSLHMPLQCDDDADRCIGGPNEVLVSCMGTGMVSDWLPGCNAEGFYSMVCPDIKRRWFPQQMDGNLHLMFRSPEDTMVAIQRFNNLELSTGHVLQCVRATSSTTWRHLFDEARENDKSPVLLPNGSKLDELMLEENNPMDSDDDAGISDAM